MLLLIHFSGWYWCHVHHLRCPHPRVNYKHSSPSIFESSLFILSMKVPLLLIRVSWLASLYWSTKVHLLLIHCSWLVIMIKKDWIIPLTTSGTLFCFPLEVKFEVAKISSSMETFLVSPFDVTSTLFSTAFNLFPLPPLSTLSIFTEPAHRLICPRIGCARDCWEYKHYI